MGKPTSRHVAKMRTKVAEGDDRLTAATYYRNCPPIIAELSPWLRGRTGKVLEIGAGSGQHAAAFALAFPGLEWYPSDPDECHRASVTAWAREWRAPERDVLDIDAAFDWASDAAVRGLGPLSVVYSGNVIHISPPTVMAGIIRGAGATLAPAGLLIFYGPFAEHGVHTGSGNATFDERLRADNPDWGLRDITELDRLADQQGLARVGLIAMPANNRLVIYRRSA